MGLGELYSLLCAVTWASAVVCMRKTSDQIDPLSFNIFKIGLSLFLFVPTIWIANESLDQLSNVSGVVTLMISGAIGIGIADTLWLMALEKTNASTVAIVDCVYSPSVIALSFLFLGESLSFLQTIGCLLVVGSVFLVIPRKRNRNPELDDKKQSKNLIQGVFYGIAAVILMAIGIVMMKPQLDKFPLFLAIEIRLVAGFGILLLMIPLRKEKVMFFKTILTAKNRGIAFVGAFLGAYVAMIFWVAGTKYTSTSIAAILNQTSTIFIIFFAVVFLKEKLTTAKILGCCVGFLGALLAGAG